MTNFSVFGLAKSAPKLATTLAVAVVMFSSAAHADIFSTPLTVQEHAPTTIVRSSLVLDADERRAADQTPALVDAPTVEALAVKTEAPEAKVGKWSRDADCLATALYFEARGETEQGQKAVAEVIMTRSESGRYPGSICGVIYQGSNRYMSCQFTFTCDGHADKPRDMAAWGRAKRIAALTLSYAKYVRPITNWATHYHANSVKPRWASKLTRTATIGSHIFYREPRTRRG